MRFPARVMRIPALSTAAFTYESERACLKVIPVIKSLNFLRGLTLIGEVISDFVALLHPVGEVEVLCLLWSDLVEINHL